MDWPYLDNKIFSVMERLSVLNGEEYEGNFYNPHPYPGWEPELKHYMWGFIEEFKKKEAAGCKLKTDAQSLGELFDLIIRMSDLMKDKMEEGQRRLGVAATDFNYLLLKKLYTFEDENGKVNNVFISSGRIQAVLSLLSNWVDWYNHIKIVQTICGKNVDIDEANEMFGDERFLLRYISERNCPKDYDSTIDLNTIMWIQDGLEIDKMGLIDTEKAYNVKFRHIDFRASKSLAIISKQIEKFSHGLLKNVRIPVTVNTKAILADILYFKGVWQKPFDEYFTRKRNFYYHGGMSKVPMMKQTDTFGYYENDILQSIDLPYDMRTRTCNFSMLVHLPKKGHRISEALEFVSDNYIGPLYETKEVEIILPKFEIELRTSLKNILKEIGLNDIFEDNNALPNLLPKTRLNDIIQQGRIKVDEYGTEASMATIVDCPTGCVSSATPKPVKMKVNHEFIFEIIETFTGQRFFSGIVNKL